MLLKINTETGHGKERVKVYIGYWMGTDGIVYKFEVYGRTFLFSLPKPSPWALSVFRNKVGDSKPRFRYTLLFNKYR